MGNDGWVTDGIQEDFSFHQHGAQLLSGSYGAVFTDNMLQMINIVGDFVFSLFEPHRALDFHSKYLRSSFPSLQDMFFMGMPLHSRFI